MTPFFEQCAAHFVELAVADLLGKIDAENLGTDDWGNRRHFNRVVFGSLHGDDAFDRLQSCAVHCVLRSPFLTACREEWWGLAVDAT